jgi:hypothetical protein
MNAKQEAEVKKIQSYWTAKTIREAQEAGLTYKVNFEDPEWSEKLDLYNQGKLNPDGTPKTQTVN